MANTTIPSIYLAAKNMTSAWEHRKRHFEKFSGLKPDEAREKVGVLALHVIKDIDKLAVMIDEGELD